MRQLMFRHVQSAISAHNSKLLNDVAQCTISGSSLRRHARKDRNPLVDVVDNENLNLSLLLPVQPANVLGELSFPRDWHCQKQGVESLIVETLTNIAAGRQDKPLLVIGHPKGILRRASLCCRHPAPQYDDIAHEAREPVLEIAEMIPSLRSTTGERFSSSAFSTSSKIMSLRASSWLRAA